jgi:serine/threonine protein kinase/tetratricopeptide (TPR) repeat protein
MAGTDPAEPPSDAEFDSVDGLLGAFFRDARGSESASPIAEDDFGPFRIRAPLGQGGMGQVFLAEQQRPVQRQVALKILRTGLDSRALLLRFAAEQQVLARMNHDCIAKVFDAGCSRLGRPFFVMEYVPGRPITEYCDRNRLTLERRLELFLQVCDGVQHAHDNAVLHRDLKPGNIMVADQGSKVGVKIIDFGLARALDAAPGQRAAYSRFGAVLGTPDYMSPEQASGSAALTAATDVWSLGVILYELLVGVRPFDGLDQDSPLAAQRRIVHETVPLPSSRLRTLGERGADLADRRGSDQQRLGSRLRGDLDWIVLRALHKEPTHRYPSARALAEDVAAFLAGRPVTARAESRFDRVRRWVRRSPGLAGGLLVAAVAVVVSAIVVWQSLSMRRDADAAAQAAVAEQQRAGDPRLLQDLLDPERLTRLPYEAQRSLLEVALQFHQRRLDVRQDTTAVRAEVADAHVEIGTALRKLGRAAEARQALTKARSLADGLLVGGDSAPVRACRGRAADGLSRLARDDGDLQQALPLAQAAVGDLRAAVATDGPAFRAALAETLGNMVETLYDLGRPQEALVVADEHIALLEEVAAANPGAPPSLTEVLRAHCSHGLALSGIGKLTEARDTLRRAIDLGEASARANELDPDTRFLLLAIRRLLARTLHRLAGNRDEGPAGEEGRKALAEVRALVAEYPGSLAFLDQLARCLQFLAELSRIEKDLAAAKAPAEEALQVALRVLESAPDYRRYSDTGHSCLVTAGRIRAALGERDAVADETLALAARMPVLRMGAAQVFAQLSASAGEPAMATRLADQAVGLLKQTDTTTPRAISTLIWSRDFFPLRRRPDFNALAPAPKDRVDDRESIVPVPAQWLCGQTADQVQQLVDAGWRVTDVELESAAPPRFAVAVVRNEGVYRRDVFWLADADSATVNAACAQRNARVADFAVLVPGAEPRFAVVLCQRDDVQGWLWLTDTATKDIEAACQQHYARPFSVSVNLGTSPERLSATLIGNHQWDYREWRMRVVRGDVVEADHREGWRITDLARLDDDRVRCIETRSEVAGQRLLIGATEADVRKNLEEHGCRVAAFCTYERAGQRLYDAVLNPNR